MPALTEKGFVLPYPAHIMSVMSEVYWAITQQLIEDPTLALVCAVIHDVGEDTKFGHKVEKKFGLKYAQGMDALTKDTTLPKEDQMKDSLRRILLEPPAIAVDKMADRTVNMNNPPEYWGLEKRIAYRNEAVLIHDTLGSAHEAMARRLMEKIHNYEKYLV